jgi:autotransporter-associated beta strand protein
LTTISGYTAMLSGTNCQFDVAAVDGTLNFNGALGGSGSLVKIGLGTLNLSSNNTYTGNTIISNGTLAFSGLGSISNSLVIAIGSNGTLDVTAQTEQALTLNGGQTLTGNGSINGSLVTLPGSTLAPGGSISTLTISNNLALAGDLVIEVNKGASPSNDLCVVLGAVTNIGTGTVTVTNLGPALALGDSFKIFSQPVLNGNALTIAFNNPAFLWTNRLAVDGTIAVSGVSLPTILVQPRDLIRAPGGSASFQVSATNATAYQWRLNSVDKAGATSASLSLTNIQMADFGTYTVLVSGTNGSVLSNPARLILATQPTVTSPGRNMSTFSLAFTTQSGPDYTVEYKNSLSDPAWQVVASFIGFGLPITITDNAATNSSRFYRVHVQ